MCLCFFFPPQKYISPEFYYCLVSYYDFVFCQLKNKKKRKDLERLSWHWVINTGQKMDHQKNKAWREKSCLSVRPGTNAMEALRDKWGFFSFSDDPFSSACIFFFICVYKLRTGKRKQKKKERKGQKLMNHHTKEMFSLCPSGLP